MTTHFTSHFRRPIGVLAGLSLLASLLVAVPGPIKAADPQPDYLASFEACPEDVIPSADFSDVSSRHENAEDIDCIAYYGITKGTSPTTYSPSDPVIREHMALFLVRLANLVGIRVPRASDTLFEDIADLTETSQEAISQIYQLGITIGATTTTYAPARKVTRGEMALFLQRLMDLMDPVRDGRDSYGYIPEDVDDNRDDFDIAFPFRDLEDVRVTVFDAVTQLYELGIASGLSGSSILYGPTRDMSRAAMAEFMAGILDHSNLRPEGVTVQVAPTRGLDDFEIVMMISVRDSSFDPVDDRPVDWFYTDDEDGGLDRGECDEDLIQPNDADCVWDEDDDDETDRDGNIFEDNIDATPGETLTFYAWAGRRDGDEFDERTVAFSKAEARSVMGADSISVVWDDRDIPSNAYQVDEAYIVDLDIDSVEFTVQLLDDEMQPLEMEGVAVEVEVDSRDVLLFADDASAGNPDPNYDTLTGDDESDATLLTDSDGEAVFELDAPRRNDRLDAVTFIPDCQDCDDVTIEIIWSEGDPVLVTAQPNFDLYRLKSASNRVSFTVDYRLYNQYGNSVSSSNRSGREGTTVRGNMKYGFYSVADVADGAMTEIVALSAGPAGPSDEKMGFSRGRLTTSITQAVAETYQDHEGFLVVLKPTIFSDSNDDRILDPDEIRYAEDEVVVWIVNEATKASDLPMTCALTNGPPGVDLLELAVNADEDEFRTCFTLWSYDGSTDRFFIGEEEVSVEAFEERLHSAVLTDLTISIYSTRRSGLSVFKLSS